MPHHKSIQLLALLMLTTAAHKANAQPFGVGNISGVFEDVIATQPSQNYIVPANSGAWITPTSGGAHTSNYTWGLTKAEPPVFYLDGLETPLETINALNLSFSEEQARVSRLIVPSTNSLQFTGAPFATLQGQPFVAGLLNYTNGTATYTSKIGSNVVINTTSVPSVRFEMTSTPLAGGSAFSQTKSLEIVIVTTPNDDLDLGFCNSGYQDQLAGVFS